MTAIHVEVTAEDIAAAGTPPGEDAGPYDTVKHDPVEIAIARVTGCEVMCDSDVDPVGELATIGQGDNTLVARLPDVVHEWINAWYAGRPAEPFAFRIDIEDWLVALIARAATTDEQAIAVIATDPAL